MVSSVIGSNRSSKTIFNSSSIWVSCSIKDPIPISRSSSLTSSIPALIVERAFGESENMMTMGSLKEKHDCWSQWFGAKILKHLCLFRQQTLYPSRATEYLCWTSIRTSKKELILFSVTSQWRVLSLKFLKSGDSLLVLSFLVCSLTLFKKC